MYSKQAILEAQEFHRRRERLLLQEREALRRDRLEQVRRVVARIAPAYSAVKAVYLFGSLVQPGAFGHASDVDLAVDCDDVQAESGFWRALEEELEIDVDVRPRRGAVAWAVSTTGECIYDREAFAPGAQH